VTRGYRLAKRAELQEETREKIVRATMALHDEKGVATTSYSDVAERAGVGPATVYRHFPTLNALVAACGAHVWEEMRPPRPEDATAVFAGVTSRRARLKRLVQELDAFYARGAGRLWAASQDRDRIPELDQFLRGVEAGVAALAEAALGPDASPQAVKVAASLSDFTVWRALNRGGTAPADLAGLQVAILEAAIAATERG
jgi:AcrR family transcriptional regulator